MKTTRPIEKQTPAQRRAIRTLGNRKGKVKTEEIDAALRGLSKRGGSNGSF